MRLYRPHWKSPDGPRRKSPRWWIDFTDGDRRRWRLPGLPDKRATEALARNVEKLLAVRASGDALSADLLTWLEQVPSDFRQRLADAGLIGAERVGGLVPLMELDAAGAVSGGHLADFVADMAARNVSAAQQRNVTQRCRVILHRAGCRFLRDLSAARIQAAIAGLAAPTAARPAGLGKQSLQHHVRAVKQFSRWLRRERRTAEDVLVGLKGYNAETDRRHERRGFTADEMTTLVTATRQAPERWKLSGEARAAAYALAGWSGLRRNEIRTLTAASFDLFSEPPRVTVEAAYSKHRRRDVQPLPADVAVMLAGYLAGADPARPFALPDHTARMLREDMAAARVAWIAEARTDADRQARTDADFLLPRDSRGLVLDFHSLRHSYVTAICGAVVSPRVMMELSRHSDPRLTMKRYSRVSVAESAKALAALPKLAVEARAAAQAMTGTDDIAPLPDVGKPPSGGLPDSAKSFAKCVRTTPPFVDSGGRKGDGPKNEIPLIPAENTGKRNGEGGIRTRGAFRHTGLANQRTENVNYGTAQACGEAVAGACHSLCQTRAENDGTLDYLVAAWPRLSAETRRAVCATAEDGLEPMPSSSKQTPARSRAALPVHG